MSARNIDEEGGTENTDITFRRLRDELNDLVALNADIQIENRKKDQLLGKKEAQLNELREIFSTDSEQLEFDHNFFEENFVFQVKVQDQRVSSLTLKKQRLTILEEENVELKRSIVRTERRLRKEGSEHAAVIHQLNKKMQTLRSEMEMELRRKLSELDRNFQEKSFSALSDKKKQTLLKNSCLKDEMILQKSGISNLDNRSNAQQNSIADIQNDFSQLEIQEDVNMEMMSSLFRSKSKTSKLIESIQGKEKVLLALKERIFSDINSPPLCQDLEFQLLKCNAIRDNLGESIALWDLRVGKLQELSTVLQPLSDLEAGGYYNALNFPFSPLPMSSALERTSSTITSLNIDKQNFPEDTSAGTNTKPSFVPRIYSATPRSTSPPISPMTPNRGATPTTRGASKAMSGGFNIFPSEKADQKLINRSQSTLGQTSNNGTYDTSTYAIKLTHLGEILRSDRSLAAVLHGIKGREALLMSKGGPFPSDLVEEKDVTIINSITLARMIISGTNTDMQSVPKVTDTHADIDPSIIVHDKTDVPDPDSDTSCNDNNTVEINYEITKKKSTSSMSLIGKKNSKSTSFRDIYANNAVRGSSFLSKINAMSNKDLLSVQLKENCSKILPLIAQNMISWSTLEIIKIWRETKDETDCHQDKIRQEDTTEPEENEDFPIGQITSDYLKKSALKVPVRTFSGIDIDSANADEWPSTHTQRPSEGQQLGLMLPNSQRVLHDISDLLAEASISGYDSINGEDRKRRIATAEKSKAGMISSKLDTEPFIRESNAKSFALMPPLKKITRKKNENALPSVTPILHTTDDHLDSVSTDSLSVFSAGLTESSPTGIISTLGIKKSQTSHMNNKSKANKSTRKKGLSIDPMTSSSSLKPTITAKPLLYSLSDSENKVSSVMQRTENSWSSFSSAYRKDIQPKSGSDLKIRSYLKDLAFSRDRCDSIHQFSKGGI